MAQFKLSYKIDMWESINLDSQAEVDLAKALLEEGATIDEVVTHFTECHNKEIEQELETFSYMTTEENGNYPTIEITKSEYNKETEYLYQNI